MTHLPNNQRTSHWNHTPSNVAHLPQSCLENILRKELHRRNEGKHDDEPQEEEKMNGCGYGDIRFGETLRSIEPLANGKGSKLTLESGQFIHCDYLIGADGAHSQVREHMKVDMCGQEALQTLINVHFTCDGLGEYLGVTSSVDKTRGGDGITTKMPIMEVGCGAPSRLEQALYMEARKINRVVIGMSRIIVTKRVVIEDVQGCSTSYSMKNRFVYL